VQIPGLTLATGAATSVTKVRVRTANKRSRHLFWARWFERVITTHYATVPGLCWWRCAVPPSLTASTRQEECQHHIELYGRWLLVGLAEDRGPARRISCGLPASRL